MRTAAELRDGENAPYRVKPASVRGMYLVMGRQAPENNRSRYELSLFLGTKREAEAVAAALTDVARRAPSSAGPSSGEGG